MTVGYTPDQNDDVVIIVGEGKTKLTAVSPNDITFVVRSRIWIRLVALASVVGRLATRGIVVGAAEAVSVRALSDIDGKAALLDSSGVAVVSVINTTDWTVLGVVIEVDTVKELNPESALLLSIELIRETTVVKTAEVGMVVTGDMLGITSMDLELSEAEGVNDDNVTDILVVVKAVCTADRNNSDSDLVSTDSVTTIENDD